jgi:hypothetical protein
MLTLFRRYDYMFTLPPDLLSSPYQALISHIVPNGARMARLERAANSHALAVAWSKISPESGFFFFYSSHGTRSRDIYMTFPAVFANVTRVSLVGPTIRSPIGTCRFDQRRNVPLASTCFFKCFPQHDSLPMRCRREHMLSCSLS